MRVRGRDSRSKHPEVADRKLPSIVLQRAELNDCLGQSPMIVQAKASMQGWGSKIRVHYAYQTRNLARQDFGGASADPAAPVTVIDTRENHCPWTFCAWRQENSLDQFDFFFSSQLGLGQNPPSNVSGFACARH